MIHLSPKALLKQLRFYNCVHGTAYELPCATGLVFDEAQGTCVREEQASEFAKKCEEPDEKRKYTSTYQT